ncbi:MAG: hypothetical protein P8O97_01855 [Gammaproteobacteria bacterium]|nr:hypothetical protein [Gammaproteobacteria bacterium]
MANKSSWESLKESFGWVLGVFWLLLALVFIVKGHWIIGCIMGFFALQMIPPLNKRGMDDNNQIVQKEEYDFRETFVGNVVLIFILSATITYYFIDGVSDPLSEEATLEPSVESTLEVGSLKELVYLTIRQVPKSAFFDNDVQYMAIAYETESMEVRVHLSNIIQLMPILLEQYPLVNRFFFGYQFHTDPDRYYMKYEINRDVAEGVIWEQMLTADMKAISSQYWMIPSLR